VHLHLKDSLEEQVARLAMPVLVVRVPGAPPFVWTHPKAWSQPLRELVRRATGDLT